MKAQKISLCNFLMYGFTILIICTALQGCGGDEKFQQTISLDKFQELSAEQIKQKSRTNTINVLPLNIDQNLEGNDYLLGPGDLLSIKVFETSDLDTEVRVSSRGFITVPLLGDVSVVNLSAAEAEQLIEDLYKKKYLQDPHVSVYIKEHMSKQITLIGAVNHPGTFDYVTRRRLLDVIAIGNGLTDKAGSLAYITRKDPKSGKTVNYMIDLDDLIKNGNMANNHVILGGDVIFIPESGQCFVDGAVRKPGNYPLSSNMTITEAIAVAGGLAGYANDESIKLIRFMGHGKDRHRQIVSLNYSDLQKGVGDTVALKDQDIIFVESSSSGRLFSGSGFSIGFLGTGVSFRNPEH